MGRFRYWTNAPFVLGALAYAANRWLLKPRFEIRFLHTHFNDLWMIPCVLPPLLWLYRKFGLRTHDHAPSWQEITCHLLLWSLTSEWIGPRYFARGTADAWDVLAYAVGALAAGLWWQHPNTTAA